MQDHTSPKPYLYYTPLMLNITKGSKIKEQNSIETKCLGAVLKAFLTRREFWFLVVCLSFGGCQHLSPKVSGSSASTRDFKFSPLVHLRIYKNMRLEIFTSATSRLKVKIYTLVCKLLHMLIT